MKTDELLKTRLFRGFTTEELIDALRALHAHGRNYQKGDWILASGETIIEIGLVLQGSVLIENNDVWGNRSIMEKVPRGQAFTVTYALQSNLPIPIDVTAAEPCSVMFLDVPVIQENQTAQIWHVKFLSNILRLTAARNYALITRGMHTQPKTVRERVLSYLGTEAKTAGSLSFTIPFDRQQMADYLNLDRSALSKELGKMKKEGLIDYKKNRFKLCTAR